MSCLGPVVVFAAALADYFALPAELRAPVVGAPKEWAGLVLRLLARAERVVERAQDGARLEWRWGSSGTVDAVMSTLFRRVAAAAPAKLCDTALFRELHAVVDDLAAVHLAPVSIEHTSGWVDRDANRALRLLDPDALTGIRVELTRRLVAGKRQANAALRFLMARVDSTEVARRCRVADAGLRKVVNSPRLCAPLRSGFAGSSGVLARSALVARPAVLPDAAEMRLVGAPEAIVDLFWGDAPLNAHGAWSTYALVTAALELGLAAEGTVHDHPEAVSDLVLDQVFDVVERVIDLRLAERSPTPPAPPCSFEAEDDRDPMAPHVDRDHLKRLLAADLRQVATNVDAGLD